MKLLVNKRVKVVTRKRTQNAHAKTLQITYAKEIEGTPLAKESRDRMASGGV